MMVRKRKILIWHISPSIRLDADHLFYSLCKMVCAFNVKMVCVNFLNKTSNMNTLMTIESYFYPCKGDIHSLAQDVWKNYGPTFILAPWKTFLVTADPPPPYSCVDFEEGRLEAKHHFLPTLHGNYLLWSLHPIILLQVVSSQIE